MCRLFYINKHLVLLTQKTKQNYRYGDSYFKKMKQCLTRHFFLNLTVCHLHITFYAISISTMLPNTSMAPSDTNLLTDAVYNAFENFSHVNDD